MLDTWLSSNLDAAAVWPPVLVSLFALGMALAFVVADRSSPTSRALSLVLAFVAITLDLNVVVPMLWAVPPQVTGLFAISDGLTMFWLHEWILRVRRTVPAGQLRVIAGDMLPRIGQVMALCYVVLSISYPELRLHEFLNALSDPGSLVRPQFWVFAGPVSLCVIAAWLSIGLLLNRRPDAPERRRVLSMAYAIPLLGASLVLPQSVGPLVMTLTLLIVLVGATQYHVMQGRRGQFVAQFLSPQVADLVRNRGLAAAMEQKQVELTAISVDLRGFTAFAAAHDSAEVVHVLREYYQAVGELVAEFGVTIKDINGDGILILVGAPLPVPDHAALALTLADRLRGACLDLTQTWQTDATPLGVGLGVATGPVVVGAISAAARLEYTAVGMAVNLASRLCEQALNGEILIAEATALEAAAETPLEARAGLILKGFSEQVAHFNLGLAATAATPAT